MEHSGEEWSGAQGAERSAVRKRKVGGERRVYADLSGGLRYDKSIIASSRMFWTSLNAEFTPRRTYDTGSIGHIDE